MREYLKALRDQNGLSQEVVAKKLNVSRPYYSRIECGIRKKDMDISLAQKIGRLFGVPITKIIEEEKKLRG